jgi:hypothetical protein
MVEVDRDGELSAKSDSQLSLKSKLPRLPNLA